jgi:hypothetical protein
VETEKFLFINISRNKYHELLKLSIVTARRDKNGWLDATLFGYVRCFDATRTGMHGVEVDGRTSFDPRYMPL